MGSGNGRGQLGAVLRCDMVDSTKLLAANGIAAAIDARRRSTEIVDEACASGRIIETRGDGTLIWFDSVSAAVASGWMVQERLASVADFDLRVAISVHEDTFPGVSATTAEHSQRLESACPPGAVVIDARTRTLVSGVTGAAFHALDTDVYRVHEFPSQPKQARSAQTDLRAALFF